MTHRVKLVPVRVREYDEGLGVDVSRIVGYQLRCSCGLQSKVRKRVTELREWEHVQARQRSR
jgi:hypothetical protein